MNKKNRTKYNYDKLKGRIKEIFGTQEEYAKSIGLSAVSINYKLNNKIYYSQNEIDNSIQVLQIPTNEIQQYFFTQKVEKKSTK